MANDWRRSVHRRLVTVTAIPIFVFTLGVSGVAIASIPAVQAAPLAPVIGTAASGGSVIVTLKNQYSNLRVGQGSARQQALATAQAPVVSTIKSSGGTDVQQLDGVNAVAAHLSANAVAQLQSNPAVASISPDAMMTRIQPPAQASTGTPAALSQQVCPANPKKPLLEPEALSLMHVVDQADPSDPDQSSNIATGKGVIVAISNANNVAGNPNFIRPNGQHVVVGSPTPNADAGDDEVYGDVSSVAAQGDVVYDMSTQLPFSHLPAGCTFTIEGDAPGATIVDENTLGPQGQIPPGALQAPESEVIAGIDNAVVNEHADVVSESFGFGSLFGFDFTPFSTAEDAYVAAGITVVISSGDEGVDQTLEVPASDPNVIAAGATTALRLNAQAYGYSGWVDNNITALSSGGPAPNNDEPDLVAIGYGGEAACSLDPTAVANGCPGNTVTEAFGGTSESAPLIAGAAADVIQAYADSHGGARPSPALVKEILCGTATDIDAPASEQGAGLVNVYAAVRAAQQAPGATGSKQFGSSALIPSPTQLRLTGTGGSATTQSVSLYNSASQAQTVTAKFRSLGPATQLGQTVTENVSAPPASAPVPPTGPTAAAPITFSVPPGVDRLNADFRTPNPNNDAIIAMFLFDPQGRLVQISYDYSTSPTGPVSNLQHVEVSDPTPGRWTADFYWNNGRSHLQEPPLTPGSYRGPIVVQFSTQNYITALASGPVTIPGHSSASIPLSIRFPAAAGQDAESIQFVGSGGGAVSVPVTTQTLIPSAGGNFVANLASSVARGQGPMLTYQIDVPSGEPGLNVNLQTADISADNAIGYALTAPSSPGGGAGSDVVDYGQTPITALQPTSSPITRTELSVPNPEPGLWTVQVTLDETASGKEFTQNVFGNASYGAVPAFTASNVPDSASVSIPLGDSVNFSVAVTNTGTVSGAFALAATSQQNIDELPYTGFDTVTSPTVTIGPGATATIPGTLTAISGAPFGLVPPFVNQDVLTVDEQAAGSNVVQIIGGIPVEFTTSASS
jgi:Subtilase family